MKQTNILILLFFSFTVFAQKRQIDSLGTLLQKATTAEEQLKIRKNLNNYLLNFSNEKLLDNNQEIIRLANETGKPEEIAKAERYISEVFLRKRDFDNARKHIEKALKIDDSLHSSKDLILDYNQLGRIYYNFGQPQKAIETYKKGVAIYQKDSVGNKISTLYGNIGVSYNQLNQPQKAIEYYIKQAKAAQLLHNITQKSKANYNIAYTYMGMDQYPKAEKYFFKALQDSAKVANQDYVYTNYHALGMLYGRWKKYPEAIKANEKALQYFSKTNNKLYQFDLHNNNAGIYLSLNKKDLALQNAQDALKLAKEIGFKLGETAAKNSLADIYVTFGDYDKAEKILNEIAKDTSLNNVEIKTKLYKNLYLVNKHKGNYKDALKFLEKNKKLTDSILKAQRDSKIADIETRYQTAQKEKENLQLKTEKAEQQLLLEKESKRAWYFSMGLLAALFSLVVFAYYYRRNQRQKTIIENLQKDLHHRVKNNLAIIDALIEDIKDEFDQEDIQQKLVELQNRISSINEIHRQLYHNKDITHLNLQSYIDTISHSIQESFGNQTVQIHNNIPKNLDLDVDKSFPIGLIVNEFITNSFKYAFEPGQKGMIQINMSEKNNQFHLQLSDNGKGLPNDLDIDDLDSFGLHIMKLLTKQLKGKFNITSKNGVHVEIIFPKNNN